MSRLPLALPGWWTTFWARQSSKIGAGLLGLMFLTGGGYMWAQKEVKLVEQDGVKNRAIKVVTFAGSVEEFLQTKQIKIAAGDVVEPAPATRLREGMTIRVRRAVPVTIQVDGQTRVLRTVAGDVQGVLAAAGVKIGALDRVEPGLAVKVQPGLRVKVIRGEEKLVTIEEKIPFAVHRRNDPTLARGKTRVLEAGEEGRKEKTFRIRYEAGKEVSRQLLAEKVVSAPVDRIVLVGTKAPGGVVRTSRGLMRYRWRRVMTATAYTPRPKGGTGITRVGLPAQPGHVAVDPRVIPLHTRLYIPGYGFALAADTGGMIKGNRIDLCVSSRAEAVRFGRRRVEVYALE